MNRKEIADDLRLALNELADAVGVTAAVDRCRARREYREVREIPPKEGKETS